MTHEIAMGGRCALALVLGLAYSAQGLAQSASGKDDRLVLSVSGHTLTNTDGGWGASATWLHNFSADTITGLGGEHQTIGDADWNFGILNLSHGFGEAQRRTTLYADVREGSGKDNVHSYDYSIVAVGMYQNLTRQLSLQLEDKQINVDTARGNLPKLGLQYLWTPSFSTSAGYAYSVSGTLNTRLATARIDTYSKSGNFFAGLANGRASPVVINLQTNLQIPGFVLHEYYIGVGRPFSRADTTLLLDYARLASSNHWTLTFNATLHKRTPR